MYTKQATILNDTGLHARPASEFVQNAKAFSSSITVRNLTDDTAAVNAKSMMLLLTLGCAKNTNIEISANGDDEQTAVDALVDLINSGFGE